MKSFIESISEVLIIEKSCEEIIECNDFTFEYGLKLTKEEAKVLINTRGDSLKRNGRVEFGGGIVNKIITEFCVSPYIYQSNYLDTICDLIEIFYYYKNDTLDELGDDELVHLMKEFFDGSCQGSLELLQDRELYRIADNIKNGVKDYLNISGEEEEEDE